MGIKVKGKILLVFAAFFSLSLFSTSAFANSTLYALLQKGVLLSVEHEDGDSYTIKFTDDGRYVTSDGARGKFSIEGDRFCLARDSDSHHRGRAGKRDCGVLPGGKRVGDRWVMDSNRGGKVIVAIVKRE